MKSVMRKNVFSYSKTDPAPVWLDIKNRYLSFSYLNEEIDWTKYEEQKNAYWTPKKF